MEVCPTSCGELWVLGYRSWAAPGTIGFSSGYTLQYLKVPGYLQFVRETQLDPGKGKCLSFAVPSNVLSRQLLDSVLPLLVTLCLLHNNHNNISGVYVYLY